MNNNKQAVEIRQTVDRDPLETLFKWGAFWLVITTLLAVATLSFSTHWLYGDFYQVNYSPSVRGAGHFVAWTLESHWPVMQELASGVWSWEAKTTFLPLLSALTISLFFSGLIIKSHLRARQLRDQLAGKIPDPLPVVAKDKRGMFSGRYNGKILWSSIEDRALVVGPPGTGKTVFLINQILKSAQKKMDFVCVDIKPEICDLVRDDLKKSSYLVLEIDPINGTGHRYNLMTDVTDDNGIYEICNSLVPVPDREPQWAQAEQIYLRLALFYLRYKFKTDKNKCSLPAAYALIGSHPTPEAYLKTIGRSEHLSTRQQAEKLLSQLEVSKPAQAGFGALFDRLNWLALDTVSHSLSKSQFSLKKLGCTERPIALFLKFEETNLATMGSLLSALYGHILSVLIKTSGNRRPVALYLDEIGNIPPISGLTAKLNTIRSRHLPTWMFWQSTQQMESYGHGAREVFFGSADMQIFFRSNDINTMETVEKLAGKVTKAKHSQSTDGEKVSNSVSAERVARIEAAELGELGVGEVITLYKGSRWRGEATPHYVDFSKYRK